MQELRVKEYKLMSILSPTRLIMVMTGSDREGGGGVETPGYFNQFAGKVTKRQMVEIKFEI